jgi:hypothetical protein
VKKPYEMQPGEFLVMRVQWKHPIAGVDASVYREDGRGLSGTEVMFTAEQPAAMRELVAELRSVCREMETWMEERGL